MSNPKRNGTTFIPLDAHGAAFNVTWVQGRLVAARHGPCVCSGDNYYTPISPLSSSSLSGCGACLRHQHGVLPQVMLQRRVEVLAFHMMRLKQTPAWQSVRQCKQGEPLFISQAGVLCAGDSGRCPRFLQASVAPGVGLGHAVMSFVQLRRTAVKLQLQLRVRIEPSGPHYADTDAPSTVRRFFFGDAFYEPLPAEMVWRQTSYLALSGVARRDSACNLGFLLNDTAPINFKYLTAEEVNTLRRAFERSSRVRRNPDMSGDIRGGNGRGNDAGNGRGSARHRTPGQQNAQHTPALVLVIHVRRGDALGNVLSGRVPTDNVRLTSTMDFTELADRVLLSLRQDPRLRMRRVRIVYLCENATMTGASRGTGGLQVLDQDGVFHDVVHRACPADSCSVELGPRHLLDAFETLCTADVSILSKSGFSHLAAVLCPRPVFLAMPFWHSFQNIPNAIVLQNMPNISQPSLRRIAGALLPPQRNRTLDSAPMGNKNKTKRHSRQQRAQRSTKLTHECVRHGAQGFAASCRACLDHNLRGPFIVRPDSACRSGLMPFLESNTRQSGPLPAVKPVVIQLRRAVQSGIRREVFHQNKRLLGSDNLTVHAAIDGEDHQALLRAYQEMQLLFSNKEHGRHSVGNLALQLSQLRVLRWMVQARLPWLVLLQDDVQVKSGFMLWLQDLAAQANALKTAFNFVRLGIWGELYLFPLHGAQRVLCRYCQQGYIMSDDNQLRLLAGPECAPGGTVQPERYFSLRVHPNKGPLLKTGRDLPDQFWHQQAATFPEQPEWCKEVERELGGGESCRVGVPMSNVSRTAMEMWHGLVQCVLTNGRARA